jgi:hypothetical protein
MQEDAVGIQVARRGRDVLVAQPPGDGVQRPALFQPASFVPEVVEVQVGDPGAPARAQQAQFLAGGCGGRRSNSICAPLNLV